MSDRGTDSPSEYGVDSTVLRAAAEAIQRGETIVYPTETVYGLGADATSPAAVERVFEIKGRSRNKPISMGVSDVDTALEYVRPTDRAKAFMRDFLPGPVTVVVNRGPEIPDVLTAGRERVGVRVPDLELTRRLFAEAEVPVTATSANRSGSGSVRTVAALSPGIRDRVRVVVDGGRTPGGGSTVVDPDRERIHRRGQDADAVEKWLADQ